MNMPPAPRVIARTARLRLREIGPDDAGFIVELLNQPDFLRHIGDRGVRDPGQALAWLHDGPAASYARHGHGLWLVETLDVTPVALGLCGLVAREGLPAPDLGFAFLPQHYGRGYAFEAAGAVLAHARDALGLDRVLAIVVADNARSIALLRRLGLEPDGTVTLPGQAQELLLFRTPDPGQERGLCAASR